MQYKFKTPTSEAEANEILTLVEDRGERVLVTSSYTARFEIVPTFCYAKTDLIEVK
jgi:hypothetical protein